MEIQMSKNLELYDAVKTSLLSTMKEEADSATDADAAKEAMAQIITAMIDSLAIALVPFPTHAQVATIMALMNRLEHECKRFEKHVAFEEACKAINRAVG
jgi:hypothetical protein